MKKREEAGGGGRNTGLSESLLARDRRNPRNEFWEVGEKNALAAHYRATRGIMVLLLSRKRLFVGASGQKLVRGGGGMHPKGVQVGRGGELSQHTG